MFKRNKIEVVAPWSDEVFENEKVKYKSLNRYATQKEVAISSFIPTAAAVAFAAHQWIGKSTETVIQATEPVNAVVTPTVDPSTITDTFTPLLVNVPTGDLSMVPTGIIADKSLEVLATIMDPFIEIIVTVSFPVASLIMTFGFFIMMFGMKEKALNMIMNAGIGYVLVQMLPLFNSILRTIGEAV